MHNRAPDIYTVSVKETFLTALGASPTLEADLVEIQRRILATTGRASALALPPVVPFAFSSRPPDAKTLDAFRSFGLPALSFGSYSADRGTIRIGIEPAGFFDEAITRLPGSEPEAALFEPRPGFYLAAEEGHGLPPVPNITPPETRLRVARLLVLRIEAAEGEAWWRKVFLTTEYEGWMKA